MSCESMEAKERVSAESKKDLSSESSAVFNCALHSGGSHPSSALYDKKLLVVEDDTDLREALVDTLELNGFVALEASSAEQAMRIVAQESGIQMIISDINMGKMSGLELLNRLQRERYYIPVLLITAYGSVESSVNAMRNGAVDYMVKPFEPSELIERVKRHCDFSVMKTEAPVAVSASGRRVLQLAERVAMADTTALLLGESGTGKEVLARFIHDHSPRASGPFVAINCAAIPENMLEAMLFGYEKGAFTGAYQAAPGKFEQANEGTLLLDEVSEMEIGLQAKLLRVLQEREVERLGGRKTIPLDVRVIATSNRDLRWSVEAGKFREDLYFRLNILPLQWPPLRDRVEDILPLAQRFLAKHAKAQGRAPARLSEPAQMALMEYRWPGNIRELDNVMQRALILQSQSLIQKEDLGFQVLESFSEKPHLMNVADNPDQVESLDETWGSESESISPQPHPEQVSALTPVEPSLGKGIKRREYEIIVKTLEEVSGSKKRTAEKLGISPRTLRYKLARLREEGYSV